MDKNISTQDLLRRKSVRRYTEEWDIQRTETVLAAAKELEPLIPEIPISFLAIAPEEVVGQGRADAPCYLALYSGEGQSSAENAGFLLYQLATILSKNGIGSVPRSGSRPKTPLEDAKNMNLVMVLSAGLPAEELYRNPLEDIKRKPLDGICSNEDPTARQIVEYGRIAPSAGNGQPWYFAGDGGRIDMYTQLAGDAFNTSNTELKALDAGMACYGLYVAAKEMGRFAGFAIAEEEAAPPPKGYVYSRSLYLK